MKLEPEGKKRLEAMKKRLAAGLPLAGMLAASAAVGAVGAALQGCTTKATMGDPVVVDGYLEPEPSVVEEAWTEGTLSLGDMETAGIFPEMPENPENPEEPETPVDGEEAGAP